MGGDRAQTLAVAEPQIWEFKERGSSSEGCTHRIPEPQQQLLEDQQVPTDQEADGGDLTDPPANHADSGSAAVQLREVQAHV